MPEKTLEPDDPEQSRRFVEMALEIGAIDQDPSFAERVTAIARQKVKSPPKKAHD